MKSLHIIGLGLSVIFGCLFMALFAELYYLLWWKNRIAYRGGPARQLFYLFCWKRQAGPMNQQEQLSSMRVTGTFVHQTEGQLHKQTDQEFLFKPFGKEDDIETEWMRQSELSGPPRFLFTIVEETNEDLESEDGKSSCGKSKSLSDFLITAAETPYLTPQASPPFFTPPLTPLKTHNSNGFNSVFESAPDAQFNRMKSSPPSKFKFMQDAEEKLSKKQSEQGQGQEKVQSTNGFAQHNVSCRTLNSKLNELDDSFITITVEKNKNERA